MRILLVATISETLRGFFLPFARHFRERGWTVGAAGRGVERCPDCRGAFDEVWDVDWSRQPLDPRNLSAAPARIREIVERGQYDLVHVNTPVAAFVTRYALRKARGTGRPAVVYTAHGFHFHEKGSALKNAAFLGLEKIAAPWTDYLVVMNSFDLAMAARHRIAAPERLVSIPGIGVDRAYYGSNAVPESSRPAIRRELGIEDGFIFLMVAEFIARKRHADAIEAMTHLRDTPARLVLAGDGPLLENMKALASRLRVAGRVSFLGLRNDVPRLLRAADVAVLPSQQEGLPRAILEAMAMGIPAVGSDIRGTRELLGAGAGRLFPTGNTQALADAMREMIEHPAETRAMGRAGREQSALYDLDRVLSLYEDVYRRAAGRPIPENAQCTPVS